MDKEILEYRNLNEKSLSELMIGVAIALKAGWQPLGGLIVDTGDGDHYTEYIQTVVKYGR